MPKNKIYAHISSKHIKLSNKKIQKFKNIIFLFIFVINYILVYMESFDSFIWIRNVTIMDNFIFWEI